MDKLKNEIRELLKENLFITDEQKIVVLNNLESNFNESKIRKFHETLLKSVEKQKELIKEKLKNDPNFLSKAKHMLTSEKMEVINEAESKERLEEDSYLEELERELNNMI